MNLEKIILFVVLASTLLFSCADYKTQGSTTKKEKNYYISKGFALIYDDELYKQKVVNKKFDNEKIGAMHNLLKANTLIKIVNLKNSKVVETKIYQKGEYPKIFNIMITKKVASLLELDINNPYVEIIEVKKNKTFIAKESSIFEEEKNVAEKAPVDEVKMDNLNKDDVEDKKSLINEKSFILVIADFYYADSAYNLKNELVNKIKVKNFSVKKINDNKYRLFVGPFKNFNALKTTYISLNNLGFDNLNVYNE